MFDTGELTADLVVEVEPFSESVPSDEVVLFSLAYDSSCLLSSPSSLNQIDISYYLY